MKPSQSGLKDMRVQDALPDFPDHVAIAPLESISLSGLLRDDQREVDKLADASRSLGFFYLDLASHAEGRALLGDADAVFSISRQLAEMDAKEREQYRSSDNVWGYKARPIGDKSGNRTFAFNASVDDLLNHAPLRAMPSLMEKEPNRSHLDRSTAIAQRINLLILEKLERILGIEKGALVNLHSNGEVGRETSSHLSLTVTPPATDADRRRAFYAHTDYGSITMVLHQKLGGLQVLVPGKLLGSERPQWRYVKPLEGHAIVNLGDLLGMLTNSYFRSNIHRVVDAPGQQARHYRYSLVYFLYPTDDYMLSMETVEKFCKLKQTDGRKPKITFKDFISQRLGYIDQEIGQLHDATNLPGVFGQRERDLLAQAGRD